MRNPSNRKHVVAASAHIAAHPAHVYAIIADYREGHPRILPKQFSSLTVEQGGVGAGTIIRCQMNAFGQTRTFRSAITEPEPGRVLVETSLDEEAVVTSFIVNSGQSFQESEVTISTELAVREGLPGAIERFLSTRFLRGIYLRELALLAAYSTEVTTPRGCRSSPGKTA